MTFIRWNQLMAIHTQCGIKTAILAAIICGVPLVAFAAPPPIADEAKEPPVQYTLTAGGKVFNLNEGDTIKLEGTGANPEVTLRAAANRTFSAQGIRFDYPRGF